MEQKRKYEKAYKIFWEELEYDEEIRFFSIISGKNKEAEEAVNYFFRLTKWLFFGGLAVVSAVITWSLFWSRLKEDMSFVKLVYKGSEISISILLSVFIVVLFVLTLVNNRKSLFPLIITDRRLLYKESDGYKSVYYKNIKTHIFYNYLKHGRIEIVCCVLLIIPWVLALFVVGMIFRSMISSSETVIILTNHRIIEFVYVKYIFTRKSKEQYIELSNIDSYYSAGYVGDGEWSRPLLIKGYATEISEKKKNVKGCISISYNHAKAVKEMLAEAIENAKKQNLLTEP